MLFEIFLWLLLGFLVKVADAQVDELLFRRYAKSEYLVALAYGIIGGYLLSLDAISATVALSILLGVLAAGKADHPAHRLGIVVMLAFAAIRGMPPVAVAPFAVLLAAGYFDEKMSDLADEGKIQNKPLRWFFAHRLGTDFAAVAISALLYQPWFALGIISFDLGYQSAVLLAARKAPSIMRGHHLIIDLFGASRKKLESEEEVRRFLEMMPGKIGMTKIAGPLIAKFVPGDPKKQREWGISGLVIIAESHISVHTYPYKGTAKVDVYSCKQFDREAAQNQVARFWGSASISSSMLLRAVDEHLSLANKEEARKILLFERDGKA